MSASTSGSFAADSAPQTIRPLHSRRGARWRCSTPNAGRSITSHGARTLEPKGAVLYCQVVSSNEACTPSAPSAARVSWSADRFFPVVSSLRADSRDCDTRVARAGGLVGGGRWRSRAALAELQAGDAPCERGSAWDGGTGRRAVDDSAAGNAFRVVRQGRKSACARRTDRDSSAASNQPPISDARYVRMLVSCRRGDLVVQSYARVSVRVHGRSRDRQEPRTRGPGAIPPPPPRWPRKISPIRFPGSRGSEPATGRVHRGYHANAAHACRWLQPCS
jgi:hypothetical protein